MKINSEIPKIIHYCWFGRREKSVFVQQCIQSWRNYLPDYEIKEWTEDNFNVDACPYTAQAYAAKKYTLVVDYARFKLLYEHGGIFFDPDVEIIRPIDDLIARGSFMGCGKMESSILDFSKSKDMYVDPSLGMRAPAGLGLLAKAVEYYENYPIHNIAYVLSDRYFAQKLITRILEENGYFPSDDVQQCVDVWLYPFSYFAIQIEDPNLLYFTDNTRCIRHYDKCITANCHIAAGKRGRKLRKCFGKSVGNFVNKLVFTFQKHGLKKGISIILSHKLI